jgi:PAS domain S-box-containing protein
LWIVLPCLTAMIGLALLAQVFLPHIAPGTASLVLAVAYGAIAAWFVVSWRRQSGRRQAESEDRFRLLFEHGGVGMALLSPDGDFLQVNPALVQMLGYPAAELLGRHISDIMYSEDRSIRDRLSERTNASQYEKEKRFLHRAGHIVWARLMRVPIHDAQGAVRYHATIFIDVTARKHAEQALAASEKRLRLRFQQAFDGICLWSPAGTFLDANPALCRLLGVSREELLGRDVAEVAVDAEVVRHHLRAVLESSGNHCETRLLSQAGNPIDVEVNSAVLEVENQRLILGICRDISARKRTEAVLRRLEEQTTQARKMETLGTLVGGIAHDFNNQLTAILGNLDIVRSDLEEMQNAECRMQKEKNSTLCIPHCALEELLPCVLDAEQAAQRCARLTARLLTFSRGRVGAMQKVALDQLVGETAGALQHELPGIKVEVQASPSVWPVTADVAQMQELLLNLTANARDAMPDGGVLTLALANRTFLAEDCEAHLEARPGSFVELCVRDTGCGMTPEVRERIFEPFFTTKKLGQGAGMGLSVVFGIVKGHKGWITVHSQPGAGTSVRIYLPAAQAQTPPPAALPVPAQTIGGRILIVDDERIVRDLARAVLERVGFRVATADGGEQALDIYRREARAIDLVLLDYSMPRMNGVQVLGELQQLDPDVCVVFSSGYHTGHEVEEMLAAGARAFVPKPYRPQDIVQAIRQVLAQKLAEPRP